MAWDYGSFFPKSRPRQAKGGIKSQSKRGEFGKSWWARRWIAVLESFEIGARLARGRTYARKGQVLSVDIKKGKVTSKVQGSETKPYSVSVEVKSLSAKEWDRVVEALNGSAIYAAKLLSGQMPEDIETIFAEVGLSLFPLKQSDLKTNCSCPDWSNPCKHVAAVYYLLGEEFDRDPFLIFRMRGLDREELMSRLGEATPSETEPETIEESQPLPVEAASFWQGEGVPDDLLGEVDRPPTSAGVLRRLGGFPFWRAGEPLADALEPTYREAGQRGLGLVAGEREASGE